MKSTGRHSENSGYLVILLLMVGLTAFSHSMKELTEIHQLTLDASRLVAQWSGNFTPAEIPPTPIQIVKVEKLESCESKQSAPSVELPGLTVPSAVAPSRPRQTKAARIERALITIPGAIRFNPRDREMILKTLNRSINLRIASS
jgi:hypothetical protein